MNIKLRDILFESIYNDYKEELARNEFRKEQLQNAIFKKFIVEFNKYLDLVYGNNSDDKKTKEHIIAYLDSTKRNSKIKLDKETYHLYWKEYLKLFDDLREIGKYDEAYKLLRKYLDNESAADKMAMKWDNATHKKFQLMDDNYLELKGNINSKYLYHFTTINRAVSILEDNMMYGNDEEGNPAISFTTNKNLVNHNNVVFWYPSEYSEGVTNKNLSVCFVLDFNKIKNDYGKKIKQGNEYIGTNAGEAEIRLRIEELENLDKYVLSAVVDKDKITNNNDLNKFLKLCNDKNIIVYFKKKK